MVRASFWLMWELGIDVWVKIMYSLPWDWSRVRSEGTAGSFMTSKEIPLYCIEENSIKFNQGQL